MRDFVHLIVESAYTEKYDSLIKMPMLIKKANDLKMSAIGLTDFHSLSMVVDFYEQAQKNGIKPIIGCRFRIKINDNQKIKATLLSKDEKGYTNLMKLCSAVHLKEKGELKKEELLSYFKGNVVLLDIENYFPHSATEAVEIVQNFFGKIKDDLYLQINASDSIERTKLLKAFLRKINESMGIKIVATNEVKYLEKKDAIAREVKIAIQNNNPIVIPKNNEFYFKTKEEMNEVFFDMPEALENTVEIANKCNLQLNIKPLSKIKSKMPNFKVPKDIKIPETIWKFFDFVDGYEIPKEYEEKRRIGYLCLLAYQGFMRFYGEFKNIEKEYFEQALNRLRMELGVIIYKNFTNYFLIVQDFMSYAEKKGILKGPGRGSAAGSILARCLNITTVCPIKNNLLFERFTSLERMDEPDIDLDIPKEYRPEMFQYAIEKYGAGHVAKMISFTNYKAKLAIRDVGRVMKMNGAIIDQLANSVEKSISELMEKKQTLLGLIKKDPKVSQLLEYAHSIEGLPKTDSVHAAGVVLTENHLSEELPLTVKVDKELNRKVLTIQIPNDNSQLERLGHTKIDFLSSLMLENISKTYKNVKQNQNIEIGTIPIDDQETYQLYQRAELDGVFQVESKPMKETSLKIQPKNMEDIYTLLAIYRPGSMDAINMYINNKAKNEVILFDISKQKLEGVEDILPILKSTYGVIVYQEQLMQIAQVWAGYTLGEADELRRAVSKKKVKIMEQEKKTFLKKSIEMKRDEKVSVEIFNLIEKFANYGYNRSHAVAYGEISYKTAYLKTHYPVEFMAASITLKIEDKDNTKASEYVKEAIRLGIEVEKPNINESMVGFEPKGNKLIFGLGIARDVGKAALSIVNERKKGKFHSFENFMQRVYSKSVNVKAISSLIKIGAFDEFGNRRQLLESLKTPTKANAYYDDQILFSEIPNLGMDYVRELPNVEDFNTKEKFLFEEEMMGITFSPSPIEECKEEIETIVSYLNQKESKEINWYKWFGGSVLSISKVKDKAGNMMAFIKIDNGFEKIEVPIFSKLWLEKGKELQRHELYFFTLKVDKNKRYSVENFEKVKEKKKIEFSIPAAIIKEGKETLESWMKSLATMIKEFPGKDQFILKMGKQEKEYQINANKEFLEQLEKFAKDENIIQVKKVRYV